MIQYVDINDVLELHYVIRNKYENQITLGKIKSDQIESILQKSQQKIFGNELYDTVFKKAACILEGIIRTHPFPDGNKRTAVLAMISFLKINNYRFAIPIDAVKFLTGIAMHSSTTPDDINNVTTTISEWIEKRSSDSIDGYDKKLYEYFEKPIKDALESGGTAMLREKLDDWFQVKTNPEYSQKVEDILDFMVSVNSATRGNNEDPA